MDEKIKDMAQKNNNALVIGTYNILFTNDIASTAVLDAMEMLKKSKYYRHKIKKLAGDIKNERLRYEKFMRMIVGNKIDFFAEANDRFLETVSEPLTVLHYSIKSEFDKVKGVDSELFAYLEKARVLCDFSVAQYDLRMQEMCELDYRLRRYNLVYLRLTRLAFLMNTLMEQFTFDQFIEVNTKTCQDAMRVLARKLANAKTILDTIDF